MTKISYSKYKKGVCSWGVFLNSWFNFFKVWWRSSLYTLCITSVCYLDFASCKQQSPFSLIFPWCLVHLLYPSTGCISTNFWTARVVNVPTFSWSFLYFTTTFRMIPFQLGKTSWIIPYWYLLVIVLSCFMNSAISHTLISWSGTTLADALTLAHDCITMFETKC